MTTPNLITRRAPLTPSSYDAEAGTIEAVISTGAAVQRRDYKGSFKEVIDTSEVSLRGLVGIPLLDGHNQWSASNVVGKSVSARREGKNIIGKFKLSGADDVRSIVQKLAEGTLDSVSIGYHVAKQTEVTKDGERTITVVPSIREVSIVSIPADSGTKVRSNEMEDDVIEDAPALMPEAQQIEIRTLGRAHDLQPSVVNDMIGCNLSVEDAGKEIAAAFKQRSQQTPHIRVVSPSSENPAVQLERRTEALHCRVAGGTPSEHARPFMGYRLLDFAREAIERQGISTRSMDADQIFTRGMGGMHGTSDFSQLVTGVGNRTLMSAYQIAQSPLKTLARQTTAPDFRTMTKLKLSDTGPLKKVTEHGELTHTTRGEASESYAIDTYGSLFALSRKALINDDLGAFTDWGNAAGRAAAQTEAELLWSLLSQSGGGAFGPVMTETTKRMFSADHANLYDADGDLKVENVSIARQYMRTVKGIGPNAHPLGLAPKYILCGPEMETQAEKFLATANMAYHHHSDTNPFAGALTALIEPRIVDSRWYIFADPAQAPTVEYAYLAQAPGPQLSSREGWDVLGMEFRVVLDFGCGAVDWRGAWLNSNDIE